MSCPKDKEQLIVGEVYMGPLLSVSPCHKNYPVWWVHCTIHKLRPTTIIM